MKIPSIKSIIFLNICALIFFSGCKTTSVQTDAVYFTEDHGAFYTNQLTKAQSEIPFTIILPKYIPAQPNTSRIRLPGFKGPLKSTQTLKIELDITYVVDFDSDTKGIVTISENNYPVTAPDPALNPDEKYINVNGKQMVTEESSSGSAFWFDQDGIYIMVVFDNVSSEEAFKVIESMVKN
jgi:hypothetical protein